MGQFIFFFLFVVTLIVGAFAYFAPSQKPISPMKFMMDTTGYTTERDYNHKKTQELNLTMTKGLLQVRRQMDELAIEQNKFLDTIQDQQQVLKNAGKEAGDIMLMEQQAAGKGNKDVLQIQALASAMQDEQRILVANGQDLVALNNQLMKSREWIADQIDAVNINNETSLSTLKQRYDVLKDQAAGFFDKVTEHNQEVRDRMSKIQDQMQDLANNARYDSEEQQQTIKEHIATMLDKEHEDMIRLADSEERSRNLLKDSQQNLVDSQELFNDSLQRSQDMIDDERQKAEDQKLMNQQRVEDEMQRIRDQQNR